MAEKSSADKSSCCCSDSVRLIFPCSGAADVGVIADRLGRKMSIEGLGSMYCLAGIGGHVSGIIESTKSAGEVVTIDGCPVSCATEALEHAGFKPRTISLKELGFVKGKSPANEANIKAAFSKIENLLE